MTYGPKFPLKDSCRTHGISYRLPHTRHTGPVSRRTASWQQAVTRRSKNWFYRQCHDIVHHDHADIDIKESDLIKIIKSRDFLK